MGERRDEYDVSLGKPEEKQLLGRHGRRREDNLKRIFKSGRAWTRLIWAQHRDM
jgi:hypothetical protein